MSVDSVASSAYEAVRQALAQPGVVVCVTLLHPTHKTCVADVVEMTHGFLDLEKTKAALLNGTATLEFGNGSAIEFVQDFYRLRRVSP